MSGTAEPEREHNKVKVLIHYIKNSMFRSVYVDGIFGGVTPRGNIHMSIWNERHAIPQTIQHEIEADGTFGKELTEARIGKTGVIRDVSVDIIMDLQTAIAVRKWLDEKIQIIQDVQGDRK